VVKALELAIERVRKLPADSQEYLAGVLEDFAAENEAVYQLSAEENALIDAGVADIEAGRIVSDADMAAFWDRHRG
jgi:predicted transcriptional regulator